MKTTNYYDNKRLNESSISGLQRNYGFRVGYKVKAKKMYTLFASLSLNILLNNLTEYNNPIIWTGVDSTYSNAYPITFKSNVYNFELSLIKRNKRMNDRFGIGFGLDLSNRNIFYGYTFYSIDKYEKTAEYYSIASGSQIKIKFCYIIDLTPIGKKISKFL